MMQDKDILELFLKREECAVSELSLKCRSTCLMVAENILKNKSDAEECVNDAFFKVWSSVPPKKPEYICAYAVKITRNSALDRLDSITAQKRADNDALPIAEELLCDLDNSIEHIEDGKHLTELINRFLAALPVDKRKVFVRRYWYMSSVKDIAKDFNFSESKVKMLLQRTRLKLKGFLSEEGIDL